MLLLKVSQLILWNAGSNVKYVAKEDDEGNENLICTLTLRRVQLNLPDYRLFLAGQ